MKQEKKTMKAYNMISVGENDAEINMYGEVVDNHPVDWWTGEKLSGNFIAVDEFLKDLEELSSKDNITVHINSVGGSLYGGISIYNRLKNMKANITTVNDGLAASAGSIIFQAGNKRKVNAGSNVMIHSALGFLYGYYQVQDLKNVIKQLEAGNKAAVNIYAQASGRDPNHIKDLLNRETWLTGQEAVDEGLADEVIDDDVAVDMKLFEDKQMLMVNGFCMSTKGLSNIPHSIPVCKFVNTFNQVSPASTEQEDINKNNGGKKKVEIKNADDLRTAYPEFISEIEAGAQMEATSAERNRLEEIEEIQASIGDVRMVKEAKYGKEPLTAEQLALKAMKQNAKAGIAMVGKLEKDAKTSGAASVAAAPDKHESSAEDDAKASSMIAAVRPKKGGE